MMAKQFLEAFSIQPGKRYTQYIHINHLHAEVVSYVKTIEILLEKILNFEEFSAVITEALNL